jgi:spore germination cell wall hydrolase CwlJ-like protein
MKTPVTKEMKKQVRFVLTLIISCVIMFVIIIGNIIHLVVLYNKEPEVITKTQTQVQVVEKPVEVIVEKEVEVNKPRNYSYDELYCMAVVIYNEAGSSQCTDQQREYVGYVVLNRVKDSRYPNTIREVLQQSGQYEGLGDAGVNFAPRSSNSSEAKALERAWKIAKQVLENRDNIPIPVNVVFQAEFKQGSGVYKQIGNTFFCYA